MRDRILARYEKEADFAFPTSEFMDGAARKMIAASGFVGRDLGQMLKLRSQETA
jgi:hypothetical protein